MAYEMRISDWISDVCSSDLSACSALGAAFVVADAGSTVSASRNACPSSPTSEDEGSSSPSSSLIFVVRPDRKSVVQGKSVSVRVDLGGRRIIKKNNITKI